MSHWLGLNDGATFIVLMAAIICLTVVLGAFAEAWRDRGVAKHNARARQAETRNDESKDVSR